MAVNVERDDNILFSNRCAEVGGDNDPDRDGIRQSESGLSTICTVTESGRQHKDTAI